MTRDLYFTGVDSYFSSASKALSENNYKSSHMRVKAGYNAAKSFILAKYISQNARVLDLGCGNGTEMLKFASHRPLVVVLVDLSADCLDRADNFGRARIKYPFGLYQANVFTDDIVKQTTLTARPKSSVTKRVVIENMDLITTFSLIEYCPDMTALYHLCKTIYDTLSPGGSWVGCVTDGDQLIQRCDESGGYQDSYCRVQLQKDNNSYEFQTVQQVPQMQFSWSLSTIIRVAVSHGLVPCLNESLLDILGNAENDRHYKRIRHASQLNGKCKLHLDDFRPLSLLSFFAFSKPLTE
jgi:SAM-dependent methyltransferase